MLSKEMVRRKFNFIRKKKYFQVDRSFFSPLIKLINKSKKKNVSLYYPSNNEVDTRKLFELLEKRRDISTSLPIISSNGTMQFVNWKLFEPLKINNYGFLEPIEKRRSISPDIIVVPLLAYDKFYNRLGYGKGYYDRFLRKYEKNKKNVLTIGLAFSFQKYKKIPASGLDVKLDYILTEKGIF